jgi:hypothetical protein
MRGEEIRHLHVAGGKRGDGFLSIGRAHQGADRRHGLAHVVVE